MATIQLPSDATEADIIQALNDLPGGGTIILPANKTIAIRSGLTIDVADRNIVLDLNGSTLQRAGDVSVITGRGQHDDPAPVTLGTDQAGNAVITYSQLPAGVAAGGWVKIVADDHLPGDHVDGGVPSRMGQAMQVLKVEGNTVTLKGVLIDQSHYDANLRASTYESGELIIRNGDIAGDQTHPYWALPLVQLRSLVGAQVENLSVHDSIGRGVSVVDSVNAQIDGLTAKNLVDGSSAALGIAISSMSSTGTTVSGLYAQDVTHAADSNAIGTAPNSAHIEHYGGDIGMSVSDSVAIGTRNFAWSWHSESINGSFDNVMAFDSYGFLMGRGTGGEMTGSGGADNGRGILLYEYGDQDSRNIDIDGVTLKETQQYSLFSSGDPRDNTVANSFFESFGPGNLASLLAAAVSATTFVKAALDPDDVLTGTAGADMLLGGKGDDRISGGDGNDYIWGGAGEDSLTGGAGRDRFAFHALDEAGDTITDFQGGPNGDLIDLSVLAARYGWDRGDPFANGYVRFVQAGDDVRLDVDANGGGDHFQALATLEHIQASQLGAANVQLSLSQPLSEALPMPEESGTLRGTEGDDVLRGDITIDHIIGGSGADKLSASVNDTLLEGGEGDDQISGNRGNDILQGGAGNDWLSGGEGMNRIYGGSGDDVLLGGVGSNVLAGGEGYDTVDYSSASAGVTADLIFSERNAGGAAGDRYSSIENLTGSDFNDVLLGKDIANVLTGGAGDDKLFGRGGTDTLRGGDGADWLDGGAWKDVLTGGNGADSFFFANIAQAGDTITDFQPGVDHIVLLGAGFGIDPQDGVSFVEGTAPVADGPTILYDQASGLLAWDPDGTGAQHAAVLANLSGQPPLSETDILIA